MLSKNLISSVLTQIPVFVLGVFSGVFSTRVLGDDGKGAFSLFQANTQLFVLIFSLGIQTGIVYFISSKKVAENIVSGMSVFVFIISSIVLVLFLILAHFFKFTNWFLPDGYNSLFYLLALFILYFLSFFNSMVASVFQAHSLFKIINSIALINSLLNLTIFSLVFFNLDLNTISLSERFNYILYATIFSLIINSALWLFFYGKSVGIRPSFNFEIKSQLSYFILYNSSIYLGMFVNFFNYRLDLWIVNLYLPEKDLSYYSLAANINQIILYLAVTIGSVLLPHLSSKSDEERAQIFVRVSRICFSFFTGIVLIAFSISSFIIPFMYGESFRSTVLPFQILLPGILFSCITQIFSIFIVSINRNKFNVIACSSGLIVTVVLDLILIPLYGINGASVATSISYFTIFFITYIFVFNNSNKITLNFFIPHRSDFKLLTNLLKKVVK